MTEVPSDYVQKIMEKLIESKVELLNNKIKEVRSDIEEVKSTISNNHTEIKGLLNTHLTSCTTNMKYHENKIEDLEKHRNTANGFFVAIGFVITVLSGYLLLIK